jgi:rod shape-determining protein MreC
MRERSIVLWVIVGAVLLAVLNLPNNVSRRTKAALRESIAPLQNAVSGFGRKVRESFRSVRGIGDAISENRKMAAELVRLRNEVRDLQALERENAQLRTQLQFLRGSERRLVPCEVIARDITGWWQTVRLGKGTGDGVGPNMAVVSSDGLAGRTVDVSSRTSDVLLISDPSCKVSAQIARTGAFGVLEGTGPSVSGHAVCRMKFINRNIPVLAGDEVVTSGLGGIFPRGLLIGYVEKVFTDESGLFQQADVIPKADLGMLTYAFVVAEQANPVDEYLKRRAPAGEEAP